MNFSKYWILFLFVVPFVLPAQELAGTKWILTGIDNLQTGISKDVAATVKVTVVFDSDSTYSGRFCSNFNGRFKYNASSHLIKFGTPSHTRMMCIGIDKDENETFTLMTQAVKYRMNGESLFIFTTNQKRLSLKRDTGQNPATKK